MLKLLAAGLIASVAMIGTIRLADADPVTITFRFNDTEQEVRGAIDAFQKQNPDIKVDLQRIGWKDARNQFLRDLPRRLPQLFGELKRDRQRQFTELGLLRLFDDDLRLNAVTNGYV